MPRLLELSLTRSGPVLPGSLLSLSLSECGKSIQRVYVPDSIECDDEEIRSFREACPELKILSKQKPLPSHESLDTGCVFFSGVGEELWLPPALTKHPFFRFP